MTENNTPVYELEKIYLKDISFESPETPMVFLQKAFQPEINVELTVDHTVLEEEGGFYEVVLNAEVKAAGEGRTIFLVAVQQAGIFRLRNFDAQQLPMMLEVACPNTLLPFIRETVADMVTKGGFPQLLLSPVNFEALYKKKLEQMQQSQDAGSEPAGESVTH